MEYALNYSWQIATCSQVSVTTINKFATWKSKTICKQVYALQNLRHKKSSISAALIIFLNIWIYTDFLPIIKESTNSTIKIKNNTLAIPAALAAIPPNPKIAAMIATTKNITVQRNII